MCDSLLRKILEVNLFAFAYRLFHRDFSPIDGASYIASLLHIYLLGKGGYVFGSVG